MVGLNPAKFYGRLLPRPRIYCDVKFSDSRVDPPESVNAALLEWASEASWKMGGTATNRKRMSGKVEGRMKRLRDMDESDEDEEAPPPLKKKKQPLTFRKESSSPAAKPKTPIERMLEPPSRAVPKNSRRRILSGDDDTETQEPAAKSKARRRRKDQAVPESDEDSDEDNLDSFLQEENRTPRRSARKSTRVQASLSPDSKRKNSGMKSPSKRIVESSESDCDSDSVFL